MVKDRVAAELRSSILAGRLSPGQRIVESKIASELNVAQASVREAINALVLEGFVQKEAGQTARVTILSQKEVAGIYQVRAVLEGLAARLVAESDKPLDELDQLVADMETAARRGNIRAFYERDLCFHKSMVELCGNPFLVQGLTRALVPLFAFVTMRMPPVPRDSERFEHSVVLHRQMVDAIRSGDPFFAENQVRSTVMRFYQETNEAVGPVGLDSELNGAVSR